MGPNVSWRLKTKVNVGMSTNSLHIQAIPKDGIWPKVKEEVKRQPEEHASELIPQYFAGKRTIQPNALDPYMCKIPADKLRKPYIYEIF
jgi:hypothetical protein